MNYPTPMQAALELSQIQSESGQIGSLYANTANVFLRQDYSDGLSRSVPIFYVLLNLPRK
jgi:hypothetical protein